MENITFSKIGLSGVKTLISWAEDEGWNPGPFDAEVFYETDPDGFYGCFIGDDMIGGGSIVSYQGAFGFMGLFIVKPEYRGQGIGRSLWIKRRDLLRSRLWENAPIGMDGVVAMQPFYAEGGFKMAFRDSRYERKGSSFAIDPNVSGIGNDDQPEVLEYDLKCFGYRRPQFVKAWLNVAGSLTLKYTEENKLKGFVVMRKVKQGYKIGPLFADNKKVAESLYKACPNEAIGAPVYLDLPVNNPSAVEMVNDNGAKYVFECARMYYGPAPELPVSKIFGITTFELG